MEPINFLKSVKHLSTLPESVTVETVANIMDEYVTLVCETKSKVFKQSLHQMFRTDTAIKATLTNDEERNFFLGKEMAFRQIVKLVEDIENAEFNELLVKINHRFAIANN